MTERTDEPQGQPEDAQSRARNESLARIAGNTYEPMRGQSTELFTRLHEIIDGLDEPVTFGETALDIGGNNGRYTQVIRELGPRRVVVVEPLRSALQQGIDSGFIRPDDAFFGTLGQYESSTYKLADSAFVLNMLPGQAQSADFIDSLMSVVRPRGLVVCSFVEPEAIENFIESTFERGRLEKLRGLSNSSLSTPLASHRFIQMGRKTYKD